MIEYSAQEELTIKLLDLATNPNQKSQVEPIAVIPLKLSDYISLDNGTAYLGFCQETINLANQLLIENWVFESSVKAN